MENIVCIEILRKKVVNHYLDVYYWKDHQQNEVDFVVKDRGKIRELIQVCYDISEDRTKDREIKSLLKASKELRCSQLVVITWDYESETKIEGKTVSFTPLWKWLLSV